MNRDSYYRCQCGGITRGDIAFGGCSSCGRRCEYLLEIPRGEPAQVIRRVTKPRRPPD